MMIIPQTVSILSGTHFPGDKYSQDEPGAGQVDE